MNQPRNKRYTFPWRAGNYFELLVDANTFFPAMLSSIQQAKKNICFEIYLITSCEITSKFITALHSAAERGVTVQILFDDFGSRGLKPADRSRLRHKNTSVSYYNPVKWSAWSKNMVRDHRKLLIVDSEIVFVGGVGLTDDFITDQLPQKFWRETMVKAVGPVTADWQVLFNQQWQQCLGEGELVDIVSHGEADADLSGRVTISHGIGRQETKRSFIHHIHKAQTSVWLATAYFVPSWRLRRALRRAARRNVDVRLLLPGDITDHQAVRHVSHRFYTRLLRAGVRIYELSNRMQHQKVALCDEWVSIGSSNFDRWNLRWNLEANQEVIDKVFSTSVKEMFLKDFENSSEIIQKVWNRRPWHKLWLEYWWGWVSRLLTKIGKS